MALNQKLNLHLLRMFFLLIVFFSLNIKSFSQACAPAYSGYLGFTSPACTPGYYINGCQVSYLGHNFTAQAGPHFNQTPAIGGTAYWIDNGPCGGSPPVLNATTSSDNTCNSADVASEITSDGGTAVIARGFVWNTTGNPDIVTDAANVTVEGGTAVSSFSSTIYELTQNQDIYIRAYATNAGGDTGYGTEVLVETDKCAVVNTGGAFDEYCETMTFGMEQTADIGNTHGSGSGVGASLEGFGFIYGTNSTDVANATIDNLGSASKVDHIAVTGTSLTTGLKYTQVDGLSPSTTYYYKAFTTTNLGTGYGNVNSATTQVACQTYYSCAAFETYDTDPSCASPGDAPTANSILNLRHDWRVSTGTALTDIEDLTSATVVNHFTATAYKINLLSGGYVYRKNNLLSGTRLTINENAQFGFDGSMLFIIDGSESAGPELGNLEMAGGSFLTRTGFTNNTLVSGYGEICKKGAFTNVTTAPGSIYGDYTTMSTPASWPDTRYGTAECLGTFVQPVELHSYEVNKIENNIVQITWTTITEEFNDYFTIYRSKDGINFTEIDRILGAGNSSEVLSYNYEDSEAPVGTVYYKLIQTDFDGKSEELGTKVITDADHIEVALHPNPTNHVINYDFIGYQGNVLEQVELIDEMGRVLFSEKVNSLDLTNVNGNIDMDQYAKGTYFIRFYTTQQAIAKKFVLIKSVD